MLTSVTTEVLEAQRCELGRALDSISVEFNNPCKYDGIRSGTLCNQGIAVLVVNFLLVITVLFFHLTEKRKCKIGMCILLGLSAVVFVILMMKSYKDVLNSKAEEIDFSKVQSAMETSLQKHYTSDNISGLNAISNNWNKFFIKYECCAVNQVEGIRNDFDKTPWCTITGTCQDTSHQIPRTCCKDVTENNYLTAKESCYFYLNAGTYKSNCMDTVKMLSVVNKDGYLITLILICLLVLGTLEIADFLLVMLLTGAYFVR